MRHITINIQPDKRTNTFRQKNISRRTKAAAVGAEAIDVDDEELKTFGTVRGIINIIIIRQEQENVLC